MSNPSPMELWDQADRETATPAARSERYLALLSEHGMVGPNPPCPTCGERFRHRHTGAGAIIRVDVFGHDERASTAPRSAG